MLADLVVRGGVLVTPEGAVRKGLAVSGGKVVAIAGDHELPDAPQVIDATGLHVLPGVIDPHVHLRAPGNPEREDVASGTAAAAAGGITTILEMPISKPSAHSAETVALRAGVFARDALVNYGFYGAANAENLEQIEAMAAAGVIGYKTFRTAPVPGRDDEFFGICAPDAADMLAAMERVGRTGLVHAVHAEEMQLLAASGAAVRRAGQNGGGAHPPSRPLIAEEASVAQMLPMARLTGGRLHIVHCSSPLAIRMANQARAEGVRISVEVCTPYLFFTEEAHAEHGPYAKINPPLRPAEVQEALWEHVRRGEVDVLGTDHSPFLVSEKEPFWDNIWGAYPGAPGLEAFVPLMLTAVNRGRLSLRQFVQLMSENSARLFGLYPAKGVIHVGADADLTLVDLRREHRLDPRRWHTKSRGTGRMFAGYPCQGAVAMTVVGGHLVARENEIVARGPVGRMVRPGG